MPTAIRPRTGVRGQIAALSVEGVVLGSATKPGIADVREMLRLGYLDPRTAAGQRRLERYRQKHLAAQATGSEPALSAAVPAE